MAAHLDTNLFLFSLVVVLAFAGSSYAIPAAEVEAICAKAKEPATCSQLLKPKAAASDLPTLAADLIGSASATATKALVQIKSLETAATNPKLKSVYASCAKNFEGAVGSFEEASAFVKAGDGAGANMRVTAASNDAEACEEEVRTAAGDASLMNQTKELKSVCSVLLVISNSLQPKA